MVWRCFSAAGASRLAIVEGTLDSVGYCTILEKVLLPFAEENHAEGWRFQQDNASARTSNYTRTFFSDTDINVLDWPSRSPDLNPIENLWGVLVSKTCKDFRQFDDAESLKQAIGLPWDSVDGELLLKLARSMP